LSTSLFVRLSAKAAPSTLPKALFHLLINEMDESRPELETALLLARNKDYSTALDLCETSIASNPSSAAAFRTRSQIYRRMGNFNGAIDDLTSAIERAGEQPRDYLFRGWYNLENGSLSNAIEDLTKAINLGDELNTEYYADLAYFFRSLAFLRTGRFDEALADSEYVRDDWVMHLDCGEVSKAQVVRDAELKRTVSQ
jgi:tetratricopeptide (TPR) repeat protein